MLRRLGPAWSESELRGELALYNYWYHKIDLGFGVVTPGMDLEPIWENIRKVRAILDYRQKNVLDIASFDGMFAFEAESLGAQSVIATDCLYKSFKNFLFVKSVLGSRVVPYFNVSAYNLDDRLDVYFQEDYDGAPRESKFFDIVQHFGLLYHLQNPLLSLISARNVLKPGGKLIIETDIVLDSELPALYFNGIPKLSRLRDNSSVWWAPTKVSLFEMLESSFFSVDSHSYSEINFEVPVSAGGSINSAPSKWLKVGRACVIATAVSELNGQGKVKVQQELYRTYRNPGINRNLFH